MHKEVLYFMFLSALAAGSGLGANVDQPAPAATAALKPNIIIFEPDDLDPITMQTALKLGLMPNTQKYIIAPGTTFNNYYVSNSHGCPTRESYFFGRYFKNQPFPSTTYTQCSAYQAGGVTPLATWVKAAGYATALLGKYSDGYGYEDLNGDGVVNQKDAQYIPPDWDYWFSFPYFRPVVQGHIPPGNGVLAADNPNEYDYYTNTNGVLGYEGRDASNYQADVLNQMTVQFVNDYVSKGAKKPLMMWVTPGAPHVETNYNPDPLPGYENLYSFLVRPPDRYENTVNAPLPMPSSFNDPNVTDKPSYITEKPLMDSADISGMTEQWTSRLEALRAVDDLIGSVMGALIADGQTNNVVFFLSDNGWMYGFDRLGGKLAPYDPSIQTPLYVNVGGGVSSSAMIVDNDIAATIVDIAQATPSYALDGTSLQPLLSNPSQAWRNRYLAQYVDDGLGVYDITPYSAIRTSPAASSLPNQLCVLYDTDETELYDYTVDPNALTNLNNTPAYKPEMVLLEAYLHQLLGCSGQTCHNIEFQ